MSYEDIMYAAAILEKVARETKNTRKVIAEYVGISNINHLAEYADVNHCLPMEQVAAEIIEDNNITKYKTIHTNNYCGVFWEGHA